MEEATLRKCVCLAVERLIEWHGGEVLDSPWKREGSYADVVSYDEGELVLTKIWWDEGEELPEEDPDWHRYCLFAAEWAGEHKNTVPSGAEWRFDTVSMAVLGGDGVVTRRHVGCFGSKRVVVAA